MASVLTEEMQMIAEDRDYVDGVENSKKPFLLCLDMSASCM